MTGGSRGIGLAIGKRLAQSGANIAFVAKTATAHPDLPGTVFTAAAEIEAAGGRALPLIGDIRIEDDVLRAVAQTAEAFGGIDICINNASAIDLSTTLNLKMKRYDLMQQVNARGTFLVSQTCLPHLLRSENPHVLTLSPPLNLRPMWAAAHIGYTIAKYGMSLTTLGLAEEFKDKGVAANSLWPKTTIATAAVSNVLGDEMMRRSRDPSIMADAAAIILARDSRACTGNFFIDEGVLIEAGIEDFSPYQTTSRTDFQSDLFLDPEDAEL